MKKGILIICLFAASCNMPTPKNEPTTDEDTTITINNTDGIDTTIDPSYSQPISSNWTYTEKTDEMDDKKTFYAECYSTNTVYFNSPYDGGSTFTLTIRDKRNVNEIMLSVSKGQFLTSAGEATRIRIKFDNEKPFYINMIEPASYNSDIVFLSPERKIISKLKKAEKVIIEPEFYEAGRVQAKFDISGLKWEH